MLKPRLLSLLAFLFIVVFQAMAQYGEKLSDASSYMNDLKNKHKDLTSIESDFVQTQSISLLNEDQVSRGKFYYKNEGHTISMEYTEPAGNKVIISNEEIGTIIGNKRSVTPFGQNNLMTQVQSMVVACMTGDFLSPYKESELEYYADGDYFVVVISPENKRIKRYMECIVLRFRTSDYTIAEIMWRGNDGNSTRYEHFNVKNNVAIDANHFEL